MTRLSRQKGEGKAWPKVIKGYLCCGEFRRMAEVVNPCADCRQVIATFTPVRSRSRRKGAGPQRKIGE